MRILYVVPYTPNPVRVRPYEFVRALAQRHNQVTLAALYTSESEQADLAELARQGIQVIARPMPSWRSAANSLAVLPSSTPLQAVYSWQPALLDDMLEAIRQAPFDAIHVEHLRGSRYGLELLRRLRTAATRPPIVWDSVDCISHLFAQASASSRSRKGKLITSFELPRTQRYEAHLVTTFDHTVVTSPVDKTALVQVAAQFGKTNGLTNGRTGGQAASLDNRIDVVPNGVDLDRFAFCGPEQRSANRIVFSGKMSYHANITAALHLVQDIMPLVWAQQPDAEVWIVGKDPAPELRALGEADGDSGAGANGAGHRRVVVTGSVPDMQPFIQQAAIAVAPLLYGAGIQNKVLEAMACGTPTIASRQASLALTATPNQDYIVAGSDEEFAASILELLGSPDRRAELGRSGRKFVEQVHSWDGAARRLEEIYAAAARQIATAQPQPEAN